MAKKRSNKNQRKRKPVGRNQEKKKKSTTKHKRTQGPKRNLKKGGRTTNQKRAEASIGFTKILKVVFSAVVIFLKKNAFNIATILISFVALIGIGIVAYVGYYDLNIVDREYGVLLSMGMLVVLLLCYGSSSQDVSGLWREVNEIGVFLCRVFILAGGYAILGYHGPWVIWWVHVLMALMVVCGLLLLLVLHTVVSRVTDSGAARLEKPRQFLVGGSATYFVLLALVSWGGGFVSPWFTFAFFIFSSLCYFNLTNTDEYIRSMMDEDTGEIEDINTLGKDVVENTFMAMFVLGLLSFLVSFIWLATSYHLIATVSVIVLSLMIEKYFFAPNKDWNEESIMDVAMTIIRGGFIASLFIHLPVSFWLKVGFVLSAGITLICFPLQKYESKLSPVVYYSFRAFLVCMGLWILESLEPVKTFTGYFSEETDIEINIYNLWKVGSVLFLVGLSGYLLLLLTRVAVWSLGKWKIDEDDPELNDRIIQEIKRVQKGNRWVPALSKNLCIFGVLFIAGFFAAYYGFGVPLERMEMYTDLPKFLVNLLR